MARGGPFTPNDQIRSPIAAQPQWHEGVSIDQSATAAHHVVAGGFGGQTVGANHELAPEPRILSFIRRLLKLILVFCLSAAILSGRPGVGRAGHAFSSRAHILLWLRVRRLRFVWRDFAEPVVAQRDRGGPRGQRDRARGPPA
jgi:hypothetical protein